MLQGTHETGRAGEKVGSQSVAGKCLEAGSDRPAEGGREDPQTGWLPRSLRAFPHSREPVIPPPHPATLNSEVPHGVIVPNLPPRSLLQEYSIGVVVCCLSAAAINVMSRVESS